MATINNLFIKNTIKYGLILGGIFVAYSMVTYIFEINMFNMVAGIINFLITISIFIAACALGTKNYRVKLNDGVLSYLQAFLSCLIISLIGALISAFYSFIFLKFIDPEFFVKSIDKMMEQMSNNPSMNEQALEAMTKRFDEMKSMSPIQLAWQSAKFNLIFSVILSLIMGLFLKQNEPANSVE